MRRSTSTSQRLIMAFQAILAVILLCSSCDPGYFFVSSWSSDYSNHHHRQRHVRSPKPGSATTRKRLTQSPSPKLRTVADIALPLSTTSAAEGKSPNSKPRNKKNRVKRRNKQNGNPKQKKRGTPDSSRRRKGQQKPNNERNNNSRRRNGPIAQAKTVSELVQNVRATMAAKNPSGRGTNWRAAWSMLKSEATIPHHTVLSSSSDADEEHITVLPTRVYNELLLCMEKEPRCWQDAIRLAQYMESGGNDEGEEVTTASKTENAAVDKYNSRPWYIPSPNYEIYHTVIECCCHNGGGRKDAHDASVYWLTKMLKKLEVDVTELKQQVNDKADKASTTITNRDRKLVRNSIQLVLSSLSKQRKWREALQLLDYTEILSKPDGANVPLTVVQYNTVLTCLARSRQAGQCQRLLQRLQSKFKDQPSSGLQPDEISYNAAISACASAGKWKEALRVLDECYDEPGVEPNIYIYTNAMRACAKGGNTQRALELLEIVKDKGLPVDSYCYTAVIDACAKGKQWVKALELFDEMEEKGIEPTQVTYSVTISALGNGLQWKRALWLLNLMREKGMKVNLITYNAAITALAKSSKNRHSAKLLPSASDKNANGDDTHEDEELWTKAMDLLKQMSEDGIEPDGFCYSSAINCCGAEGRWEEACQLIETMKNGGPKSRPNKVAYTAAISACGRAGQATKALELFQNMSDDGLAADRVAYNALFSALRVSEDPDKAYELWGEICGTRSTESSSIATARNVASPDIITLTDCIATLSRAGYTSKMDEVFREAVEQGIVLGSNELDEQWEMDLSGLPFPIARAATRYLLQINRHSSNPQDMVFITGIGKAQQKRKEETDKNAIETTSNNVLDRKDRTTSLRDFIQGILETDFNPPLESVVPHRAQGTVVIEKETLARWLEDQKGQIATK